MTEIIFYLFLCCGAFGAAAALTVVIDWIKAIPNQNLKRESERLDLQIRVEEKKQRLKNLQQPKIL